MQPYTQAATTPCLHHYYCSAHAHQITSSGLQHLARGNGWSAAGTSLVLPAADPVSCPRLHLWNHGCQIPGTGRVHWTCQWNMPVLPLVRVQLLGRLVYPNTNPNSASPWQAIIGNDTVVPSGGGLAVWRDEDCELDLQPARPWRG